MRGKGSRKKSALFSIDTAEPPLSDKRLVAMGAAFGPAGNPVDMGLFVSAVEADAVRLARGFVDGAPVIDIASFDADGLALDEGFGDLLPGRLDDSAESLAGNIHFLCGVGMIKAELVGQTDGLHLVERQHNVLLP
jgi:hypothetical protein